jgi:hypothetical protein
VAGWSILALSAAESAGFDVPEDAFSEACESLELTAENGKTFSAGIYGCSVFSGRTPFALLDKLKKYFTACPPERDNATFNLLAHYFSKGFKGRSLPGAPTALILSDTEKERLVELQNKSGCESGSWDPKDASSLLGGRVYKTAVNTLKLRFYQKQIEDIEKMKALLKKQ